MSWRIFRDDMQIVDEEQVKSMLSLGSQRTKLSNTNITALQHHAIIGVNTHATYHMYEQRRPIKFNRSDLTLLAKMKQAVHDNLNPFLGIAFNEKSEMLLLWKFCSRGTLQDVIYNDQFVLDEKFHAAFVKDITMGLEYLHLSTIGFHGALTTWATLIDRNWQTLEKRRSADIYAFGMVMYEILFRNLPYSDKTDISELVEKAANGDKVSRPSVQKDKQLHPDLQALLQKRKFGRFDDTNDGGIRKQSGETCK
ncbi:hypothetical protein TELCIR_17458 [Teladorsagia circumcincta]|uniref:Serine-threonine/tyrosine-protein kinase catalytic domain-containing protein n=1 Tax=Teladorsagia circumcincta TaxID=45464 RepID=A0A2G9TSQ2_TELCI|nr:hypothetical protein TELCIR_17458 [Teladorsagia circumcincta]